MRPAVKLLLAALLLVSPVAVHARDGHSARLVAETVDLFKAILHDRQTFSPCLFPSTWGTQLEASDFGRRLGTRNTLHSRLTKLPPPPEEILTQASAPKESICTPEQRKQAGKAAIATLVSRSPKMEADSSYIQLDKLEYSFPIYNAHYSKAVIMEVESASGWVKKKDGLIYAIDFVGASGNLLVYGKRRGKWESLDYQEMFRAEGGASRPVTPEDW